MGLLKQLNFWLTIKSGKRKFKIPVLNGIGYHNLSHAAEPWMEHFISRFCSQRKGCILDVGVNLAQTLLKIAAFDDDVAYYGFEPNPVCYNYSNLFIKANQLNNFRIFPVGLSNESAVVKLFGDNDYASGASIVKDFRKNSKYKVIHYVPVVNGDDLLANEDIDQINFIKIDVEGAEGVVIEGLQKTLSKYHPLIIMEILPVYDLESENGRSRKERQDKLLHILRNLGYAMFLIKEKEVKLKYLEDIPVHGDMKKTNYLFVPKEQTGDFKEMITD